MIRHVETIDSTSRYMMDHPEWFNDLDILSADHQTNGIGRTGHSWIDNNAENVLFSIIIKDPNIINSYRLLSIATGVIILNFLKSYVSEDNISLKWPNDVYVNGKKICGILLQGRLPEYVVIGIGFNVNQINFDSIKHPATSLTLETGRTYDLDSTRDKLCNFVVRELKNFPILKSLCVEEFNNHNYLKNKEISYFNATTNFEEEGIALDINDSGELLVSKGEKITPLSASEVNEIR